MTEVIITWLYHAMKLDFTTTPLSSFYDGTLFCKILSHYNLLTEHGAKLVAPARTADEAYSNLQTLCVWFKLLGVSHDQDILKRISQGNESTILCLLQELYTKLEGQQNLIYLFKNKAKQLLGQPGIKTEAGKPPSVTSSGDKVRETQRHQEDSTSFVAKKRLLTERYKTRHEEILAKCVEDRKRRQSILRDLCTSKPDLNIMLGNSQYNIDGEQCFEEIDSFEKQQKEEHWKSYSTFESVEKYMAQLKSKRRKSRAQNELKLKMQDSVQSSSWERTNKDESCRLEMTLANNFTRQSVFEKELIIRMSQIYHQQKVFEDYCQWLGSKTAEVSEATIEQVNPFMVLYDKEKFPQENDVLRTQELHYRLYQEKLRRRAEQILLLCKDVVSDIIDLALKAAEFREVYNLEVPLKTMREWKALFYKGLPLFNGSDEETLLNAACIQIESESMGEYSEGDINEYDILIELDVERTAVMNDENLECYLYLVGPWMIDQFELPYSEDNQNCVGYVIHRLLELKYPDPPPAPVPTLPDFSVKAVLNKVHDMDHLVHLQDLLEKSQVVLFDVKMALDLVVTKYRTSILYKNENPGGNFPDINQPQELKSKSAPKKKTIDSIPAPPDMQSVGTQFPSAVLSDSDSTQIPQAVSVGQEVFRLINVGATLPETLIIEAIIEYLKSVSDMRGWVLINYPQTRDQAVLLDFKLTGYYQSDICFEPNEVDLLIEEEIPKPDVENIDEFRISKVLPRPNPSTRCTDIVSYFTVFIDLETEEDRKAPTEGDEGSSTQSYCPTREGEMDAPAYFKRANRYASFPYQYFDLSTLKSLARLILNEPDEGFLRKHSEILFGEKVLEMLSKKQELRPVTKSSKFSLQSKSVLPLENQEDGEGFIEGFVEDEAPSVEKVESIEIVPGDPNWQYSTPGVNEGLVEALATIWEITEATYLDNLKDLFFSHRAISSILLPYRNFLRTLKGQLLTKNNDIRSDLVMDFQIMLNETKDCIRRNVELKRELHCRVFTLQTTLWRLCDEQKMNGRVLFEDLVGRNWLMKQLNSLTNVYASMVQFEVDRYVVTLEILQKYYLSVLSETVPQFDVITRLDIPKIDELVLESKPSSSSSKRSFSKEETSISQKMIKLQLKPALDPIERSPFCHLFEKMVEKLQDDISHRNEQYFNVYLKQVELAVPRPSSKKKDEFVPEHVLEQLSMKKRMLEEWNAGMEEEFRRINFRINLIKCRALEDFAENIFVIRRELVDFHNDILRQFHREIAAVNQVMELFKTAIEEETGINGLIVLERDMCYVDPDMLLYARPPPPPPSPLVVSVSPYYLSTTQIAHLFHKLSRVSNPSIPIAIFSQILLDMTLTGQQNGYCYLPKTWSALTLQDFETLLQTFCGGQVLVNWKYFLISALKLTYPTVSEILEMRQQFLEADPKGSELVKLSHYKKIQLWFEKDFQPTIEEDLKAATVKDLLFKLFQSSPSETNYTAMLLAFCKSENQVEGFVKALALCSGCCYIVDEEMAYLEESSWYEYKSSEAWAAAKEIMEWVLHNCIQYAENVVITEVETDEDESEVCFREMGTETQWMAEPSATSDSKCSDTQSMLENYQEDFAKKAAFLEHSATVYSTSGDSDIINCIWKSVITRQLVTTILAVELQYHHLEINYWYMWDQLEKDIKTIFENQGDVNVIKAWHLMRDPIMVKYLDKFCLFKEIDLYSSVAQLIQTASTRINEDVNSIL